MPTLRRSAVTRVEMALIVVGVIAWITLGAAFMGALGAAT